MRRHGVSGRRSRESGWGHIIIMSRSITVISVGVVVAILVGGPALVLTRSASAMSAADRAARKLAASTCRTQIKEQAHYKDMSWYARHKSVKACVKEALAKQQH
jgi:hypothetical protein